jgi:hypothetical protein
VLGLVHARPMKSGHNSAFPENGSGSMCKYVLRNNVKYESKPIAFFINGTPFEILVKAVPTVLTFVLL